ncbi:MAG: hypothetical protein LC800_22140 [Acidobacteria bacterium]|nr:hypothetical protein [Acidobacteriota bacterium]
MSDEKRAEAGGAEAAGEEAAGRTFTEEQSAIFSNPHGTPEATRPRTPGADSVAPDALEELFDDDAGGGAGADAGRGGKPLV